MEVSAVSIKLPTFWVHSPQTWFAQSEAQFAIRGVTADDTKYYYVVSALDSETANRALSILSDPPATDKYKAIKDFLIGTYGLSEQERASALLNLPGLGDMKPSELMDKMLALLGAHKPCFLFKHIFIQHMPPHVRTPLANSPITDYRELAKEADRYHAATTNNGIFAVKQDARTPTNMVLCSYHRRFGKKARKCTPPCTFKRPVFSLDQGNEQLGQQ